MEISSKVVNDVVAQLDAVNKQAPQRVFPISALNAAIQKLEDFKITLIANGNKDS